jgi:hypothetical protein
MIPMPWSGPGQVNFKRKGPLAALALGLIFGLPMYSNAAGIIPIVQALLGKGAALGTGTLEARVRASISPRISGRLVQVLADQGERHQGATPGDVG